MSKAAVIWLTIAAYAVFIVAVGLISSRHSKSMGQFTVGGRSAGAWVSALSYGTAYFSAVMFIGYAGTTGWRYGIWAVLPGLGNAIFGSLLAWLVLAGRTRRVTRRMKIKSMPQFFDSRFHSRPMKLFSAALIFIFLLPYSASVYKGLTSVCAVLLNVDEQVCMVVIALASAAVVVLGGYIATLKADFVQGLVMFVGVAALIVAVIRCGQVGGLAAGLEAITQKTAELKLGASDHIALWATVLMTSFGTWGLPQMIHKYYGIRDDREVRRGTVISTLFSLVIAGGGYFIGSLSRLFFSELPSPPAGGAGHPDYLIPNMLDQAGLPIVLVGVVLVLLIAASVSTLSSITITASSTLTMDLLRERFFPHLSSTGTARVTRGLCALFVVLSYFVANTRTPILDMMSYSWGILSGCFLAPYALSLYWKGINRAGAWAGMAAGFFTAAPPVVCKLFFPQAAVPFFGKVADMGPHFACAAMLLSLLFCILFSGAARMGGWKSSEANPVFYEETAEEMPAV
ncbi:MAG: sodium:solute symporter family protein [Clostridiales bacterium]|nr:sodium:solute symporter family protein [Clostridiales bacterium]